MLLYIFISMWSDIAYVDNLYLLRLTLGSTRGLRSDEGKIGRMFMTNTHILITKIKHPVTVRNYPTLLLNL